MGRTIKEWVPLLSIRQGKGSSGAIQRTWLRSGSRWGGRAAACALALGLGLAACEGGPSGRVVEVDGFGGLAVADEPYAATVGRDILGNGGTAADAAVAMYFTMAVTLPSRAGLGGGGVCISFDQEAEEALIIDFLPRVTPSGGVLPGNTRGLAVLHAQHGSQRWQYLLARAENLARFGANYSRAFVRDLQAGLNKIRADRETSEILLRRGQVLPKEGDKLEQFELSTVITGIRSDGAGYFYTGAFANRLAEAFTRAGTPVTADEVRGYTPRVVEAVTAPVGDHTAFFAPAPAYGGTAEALMWRLLTEVRSYSGAAPEERSGLLAAAAKTAFRNGGGAAKPGVFDEAELQQLLAAYRPEAPHGAAGAPVASEGASFIAGDQYGNAVACGFTMNGLFGSGRTAPEVGILMAAADPGAMGPTSPVIIANENTGEVYFAGAAAGGGASVVALMTTLLEGVADEQPLEQAIARGRLHAAGEGDLVWVEEQVGAAERDALSALGLEPAPAARLGRVNALHCPRGLRRKPDECQAVTDPRGWGLARRAE